MSSWKWSKKAETFDTSTCPDGTIVAKMALSRKDRLLAGRRAFNGRPPMKCAKVSRLLGNLKDLVPVTAVARVTTLRNAMVPPPVHIGQSRQGLNPRAATYASKKHDEEPVNNE